MKRFYHTRLFQQFIPFMILVIGGSFFIREFTKIKYKYNKVESYDFQKKLKLQGIKLKKLATLEEEYEKLKDVDLDNWENVRIPRPWEDPNTVKN